MPFDECSILNCGGHKNTQTKGFPIKLEGGAMYKKVFILWLLLAAILPPVQANTTTSYVPELTIISISLPPLQYYNEANKLEGYFVELIEAALATTSFPYNMHLYPWARSYRLAQENENVCIFSLNRIPEREILFQWVAQLAETHSGLFSLKGRKLTIRDLDEAKKKYVGAAIRNGVYHQLLMRHGFEENKNVYVVSDSDALIKLFYSQSKIDFILSDDIVLNRLVKGLNLNADGFQRQFYLDMTPLQDYIACSPKTSVQVVEQLKQAFKTIRENGVWANINNKWRSTLGNIIIE